MSEELDGYIPPIEDQIRATIKQSLAADEEVFAQHCFGFCGGDCKYCKTFGEETKG